MVTLGPYSMTYTNEDIKKLSYNHIQEKYRKHYSTFLRGTHSFYDMRYINHLIPFIKDNLKFCLFLDILYFKNMRAHTFQSVVNDIYSRENKI